MATKYWVGGSGTWDSTTTTNWSDTSGGAGGATVPTSADDVVFNANSNVGTGAFTVTFSGTQASPSQCASFTASGLDGAMTLTGGSGTAWLEVYGNVSFPSTNMSISGNGSFVVRGTGSHTLTTNGVSLGALNLISYTGTGTYTLGSALTLTGSIDWQFGNLNTSSSGNYSISSATFILQGTATRTISFNASSITLSGTTANTFNYSGSNVTFNAGTSTISFSNANTTLNGGGLTFRNVSFTGASAGTGVININGANTYNNLTFTTPTNGVNRIILSDDQTINGTLTLGASNTAIRRVFIASNGVGTSRSLILNGTLATLADVDFRDINASGTVATPWTGTRLGNCLGNSNITFSAGTTKYWNLTAGGNWNATAWATSSGGTPSVNNFPLAQDSIVIQNTGLTSGNTITFNFPYNIGNLSFATRTNSMTFATGAILFQIYGNLTFSTAVTRTGTSNFTFLGQGKTSILTTAGRQIQQVTVTATNGVLQLNDNLTTVGLLNLTQGELNLNDFNVTCDGFNSNNSNSGRFLNFGTSSVITINPIINNTGFQIASGTGGSYTILGNDPIVNINTGTATLTPQLINGANNLSFNITGGTDTLNLVTNFSCNNLDFTGFAGSLTIANAGVATIYGNCTLATGMTLPSSSTFYFIFDSTTPKAFTTAGKTLDFGIILRGTTNLLEMQDALTLGSTYGNFTFENGTLLLKAGTTNTVKSFVTTGSNLKYLESTIAGTQATITDSSGSNTVTYLSIKDSNATGGATWDALDATNVNAGNNNGWLFTVPPSGSNGNFFLMFG